MSEVISTIRDQIRYHQAQIARLEKMLEVGGADVDEDTLRGRILKELSGGPLTPKQLVACVGGKPNSIYVKLSRMRKEGAIAKIGETYKIAGEP